MTSTGNSTFPILAGDARWAEFLHRFDYWSVAMEQSALDRTQNRRSAGRGRRHERTRKIRVVGAAVAALALVLAVVGAAIYDDMHARSDHAACRRKAASDEHAMLEAFFQNPSDANAWAQIERACAK
jgi:hypothetical protein